MTSKFCVAACAAKESELIFKLARFIHDKNTELQKLFAKDQRPLELQEEPDTYDKFIRRNWVTEPKWAELDPGVRLCIFTDQAIAQIVSKIFKEDIQPAAVRATIARHKLVPAPKRFVDFVIKQASPKLIVVGYPERSVLAPRFKIRSSRAT
jgi:hypothetical protein